MMTSDVQRPVRPVQLSVRVFVVLAAIYLATWGGHYTTGDGSYKVAWAKAMIAGHVADNSAGQTTVYSKYGIGHSLLAVAPLEVADLIYRVTRIRCESVFYTLMFVINGAIFLGLVAFYLAHFYPAGSVWRTVIIMGLATIWWPYTKLDFSEPLVLTISFAAFVLIRFGYPTLGLLVSGFTLAIRLDSVAIVGPLIVWYLFSNRSLRNCLRVAVALAPSIALVIFANYVRYHSLFDRGYAGEGFSNPLAIGLYGLLFSSGKSIFLFSPPLLLGLLGWKRMVRQTAADAWLFLAILTAQILFFAKWWDWSSDDAWGVRFLIPGVLLMCIPLVTILERRVLVILVAAAGVAVQLLAVTAGGLDYLMLVRQHQTQRQALFVSGTNRIDFGDIRFDPRYSQMVGNWILLRYLLHLPPAPGRPEDAVMVGTRLSDAIPAQLWADTANWDFAWNRHRSANGRDEQLKPVATSTRSE